MNQAFHCIMLSLCAALHGCGSHAPKENEDRASEKAPAPSNRVDIPPAVRENLGMTFANVESRRVSNTLRVPGRFELLPSARREYRLPMTGRVDVAVSQYQPVKRGDVLYRFDSPAWRGLQRDLLETRAAIDVGQARIKALDTTMDAHRLHELGLREAVDLWSNRVKQLKELEAAGGGRASDLAEAQARLTEARASFGEVMEKDAELQLRRAETESELRSAHSKFDLLESNAAALLGLNADSTRSANAEGDFWSRVAQVEVRAAVDGVVEQLALTNGAWAEEGNLVLSVVDPSQVRFRAVGLQSDLDRLRSGLEASIVPPSGKHSQANVAIPTQVQIGLDADPQQRTIELLAQPSRGETWVRPGVSAFLEIATDRTSEPELAIPLSAVVRDGLKPIIFRRDPANPDKVIRMEADLGINDGRWVVINSGVKQGDEVVLNGVYQLLLATTSNVQKGGHFHADGTFHAEDH